MKVTIFPGALRCGECGNILQEDSYRTGACCKFPGCRHYNWIYKLPEFTLEQRTEDKPEDPRPSSYEVKEATHYSEGQRQRICFLAPLDETGLWTTDESLVTCLHCRLELERRRTLHKDIVTYHRRRTRPPDVNRAHKYTPARGNIDDKYKLEEDSQ